ncbi:HNH endonuclease [Burkholderia cepacia]|uniref:HNH endonuclease n=1 Tax=Burkholderia cepacia TaxID=292 RepID=UPI00385726FA
MAWVLYYGVWPDRLIDHKNGNGLDNSISNLRVATSAQNSHNTTKRINNTTGFKGVTYKRNDNAYVAQIRAPGYRKYLGFYKTPEEAYEVYCLAAAMLHGEFANFGEDRQS